jgi:hypothetical protein
VRAELEFASAAKASDTYQVRVAMAESAHVVAKDKCDDLARGAKSGCLAAAKTTFGKN